jgi:DNA-binding Lrp family transcriptional regulator
MKQDSVDELDLALINALQIAPRASWRDVGEALGIDPVTAARRWSRLSGAGLAWVTCVAGPQAHGEFCMAYIEVACAPGRVPSVAAALAGHAEVRYLHQLAAQYELLVVIAVATPGDVAEYLARRLGPTDGVSAYRSQLRTTGYREPSGWRLHHLTPAQRAMLEAAARPAARPDRRHVHTDGTDRRLFALLHEDGRVPVSKAAAVAAISEPAARRRIGRLLANQLIRPRCELAQSISGTPVTVVCWLRVPSAALDAAARRLATLREVRMCCAVAGPRNLLLMLWLGSVDDVPRVEAEISARIPAAEVVDRAICLHTKRQMSRLLDTAGRSVGSVEGASVGWPTGWAVSDEAAGSTRDPAGGGEPGGADGLTWSMLRGADWPP